MRKIRVAVIGAGGMSQGYHLPSLKDLEGEGMVEVAALCDLNQQRLDEAASKFSIPKRFTDYRQMLQEADPEAIYVFMPPQMMFDLVMDILEQGRHLCIEKPPGVSTEQAESMALMAREHGCITMVTFQRRHMPLILEARRRLQERGPITQFMIEFMKNALDAAMPPYRGSADYLRMDVIHMVDLARFLGGEVQTLRADVRRLYKPHTNVYNALMRFESGCVGLLWSNYVAGKRVFKVEIHGRGISAYVEPEERAVFYRDNQPEGEVIDAKQAAGSDVPHRYLGFLQEHRHFLQCVADGQQPTGHFADAAKSMELAERIIHSPL
jgi:virulence factor